MKKVFRRGLVVGKFCPLHRGHELLIRRALDDCDEVFVISYTQPSFPRCDAHTREQWLAELFPSVRALVLDDERFTKLEPIAPLPLPHGLPQNEAPPSMHRELVAWLCLSVLRTTVDAVFTSEDYGDAFAESLSASFRRAGEGGIEVVHVSVDRAREAVPVSGTALRANVHALRHFLSDIVYSSFVERVCFLGGESSGKSTLAGALAARLGTSSVAEYGRDLWEERGGYLELDDMCLIARTQLERERRSSLIAHRWLFCDTSPLTTLFYSHALFGQATEELEALSHTRYDHVFLCAPDFPFVQDGTRKNDAFRLEQHRWYERELLSRGIDFVELGGSVEARIARVLEAVESKAKRGDA